MSALRLFVSATWATTLAASLLLFGCGTGAVSAPEAPESAKTAPSASLLQEARQARAAGDWAKAKRLYQKALVAVDDNGRNVTTQAGAEVPEGEVILGEFLELLLLTGEYDQVERRTRDQPAFQLERARALRAQGEVEEALTVAQAAPGTPLLQRLSRELLSGELLVELGRRQQAEKPLLVPVSAYNDGSIDSLPPEQRAEALTIVGRAAHLLRYPADANEAFNEAEAAGAATPELLRQRARLFLDKHDHAHAEEVLLEAAKAQPRDPETLVLMAELGVAQAFAFDHAAALAEEALDINPRHTGARAVLAGIALRDLALAEAEQQVQAGLRVNQRDLPLLSLRAATQFLAEDPEGFEGTVEHVLELSPGYSQLFRTVGTYAEWEHRYEDIERLMRRAARLDPDDAHVRAMLGLTLVRAGSDAAGVVALRRAFDLDPYNVRVLNTLKLYEEVLPESYEEVRQGPFKFRFPKAERQLLERYVPQLTRRAYEQMVERYGYEPRAPLGIELYATRDQFAVRTSGLPRTAIQGVCFGRKLATMSPEGSPGNLGMTLWHELSHVFHITLSESRVPRWLTEGLAEWETERLDVGWSRELDQQLYRALRADRLPHLGSMSRAFTRAERMEDVATAYYASGRLARWIVESRGTEAAVGILRQLGKHRLPEDVLPEVLGASYSALDEQFRDYLARDLARFRLQFVPRRSRLSVAEAKRKLAENPDSGDALVELGLARLAIGDTKQARADFEAALDQGMEPQAAFHLGQIHLAADRRDEALELWERMLATEHDGYELRMSLARLALADEQPDDAERHLRRAAAFDPTEDAPWSQLARLARERKSAEHELEAVAQWALRSEHDAGLHARHLELLLELGKNREAAARAPWAIWAGIGDLELHRQAARAHASVSDWEAAEYEWQSALLCPGRPGERQQVLDEWAVSLEQRGQGKRARELRSRREAD